MPLTGGGGPQRNPTPQAQYIYRTRGDSGHSISISMGVLCFVTTVAPNNINKNAIITDDSRDKHISMKVSYVNSMHATKKLRLH